MPSRKQAPVADHIILSIEGFKPSYSLSAPMRGNENVSLEFLTMELDCRCLYPQRYADWRVNAHFRAERDYWEDRRDLMKRPDITPAVAIVTLRRDHCHVNGALPFDVAHTLMSLIDTGAITHIALFGPPLVRGTALPHHLSFERDLDLADYV